MNIEQVFEQLLSKKYFAKRSGKSIKIPGEIRNELGQEKLIKLLDLWPKEIRTKFFEFGSKKSRGNSIIVTSF